MMRVVGVSVAVTTLSILSAGLMLRPSSAAHPSAELQRVDHAGPGDSQRIVCNLKGFPGGC